MPSRKTSLTLIDLKAFQEMEQIQHTTASTEKYQEHSQIFEEICQEAEAEDQLDQHHQRPFRQPRRPSLTGISGTSAAQALEFNLDTPVVAISSLHRRRHSSFNPRNRAFHRREHADLDEHLKTLEDKHRFRRASFVNNLLEFSVNFDVSTSAMPHEISPALNFSCPVLSYMNEDEEDSVELTMLRRPSLLSVPEDSNADSWESLKDDGETELPQDGHDLSREYVIELPYMEEVAKPKGKRRRPHSYKLLEKRLNSESQADVIKSFTLKEMAASFHLPLPAPSPMEPKALDLAVSNTFQSKNELTMAARQPCARGA